MARYTLNLALDQFTVAALRRFKPSTLGISVRWRIKFRYQRADKLDLFLRAKFVNLLRDILYCSGHGFRPVLRLYAECIAAAVDR